MVTLTIEVDDRVEDALRQLAAHHGGDMGKALEELLAAREMFELMADVNEEGSEEFLRQQRDRSERDFAEGRVVNWETIQSRILNSWLDRASVYLPPSKKKRTPEAAFLRSTT